MRTPGCEKRKKKEEKERRKKKTHNFDLIRTRVVLGCEDLLKVLGIGQMLMKHIACIFIREFLF
jgi:hypothetical protein